MILSRSAVLLLCFFVVSLTSCAKAPATIANLCPIEQETKCQEDVSEQPNKTKEPVPVETIAYEPPANEPSISELQRAAIRYAEVEPGKITNWRRQAALKAVMPEVSVGYDTDINSTLSAPSGTRTTYIIGPDDKSRGWDFSAKWDLGDLVYNDDQTSIDSRSKLMVQLRNDILELLNPAYFERKKLQIEQSRITDKSSPLYLERELRIEELTATIDGLTGGYLSRRLDE